MLRVVWNWCIGYCKFLKMCRCEEGDGELWRCDGNHEIVMDGTNCVIGDNGVLWRKL